MNTNFLTPEIEQASARDIVESKRYAELGVHPSGEAFKVLPIELKQQIPIYIKENNDLERLVSVR